MPEVGHALPLAFHAAFHATGATTCQIEPGGIGELVILLGPLCFSALPIGQRYDAPL